MLWDSVREHGQSLRRSRGSQRDHPQDLRRLLAALVLTGNNSADLIRIVDVAADIVGKLGRNISAQWGALELIAARIDAFDSFPV